MIVLADEVERPPGMGHGAGHIADGQGMCRTVEGDRTRKTLEFLLVDHDHRSRRGIRSRPLVGRRVEPPFGVPQSGLDVALDPASIEERRGIRDAQHGPGPDQLVGKRLQPPAQRGPLVVPECRREEPAPPGPPPARRPRPLSRGGSPRSDRRAPRTTRMPAGAAPAPARVVRPGRRARNMSAKSWW